MKYTEHGELSVRTTFARGAYPVKGAVVRIRGVDENNRLEEYSLVTDEDGITPKIKLLAPDQSLSQKPSAKEVSYSTYDVEVTKLGYFTKIIYNIAIFSGVYAILPINMIPYEEGSKAPIGNIDATVEENIMLE